MKGAKMELFKLENMRDQIKDRIIELERFTDGAWESFRARDTNPTRYIGGHIDSKIDEVKFLEGHLDLIEKEIEDHAAEALGLERMIEKSFKESIEKKRDDLKREIENISKDLYDAKDKMEDILIDADYWTPEVRERVLTLIDILEFKTSQKNYMQKSLDSVLKEIEEHPETKVAKALGGERVKCGCAECRAASLALDRLRAELKSPNEIFKESKGQFINMRWLREAIDEHIERQKKAEAEKEEQWKFTYNSFGSIGVQQDKIFDSREEAERYMHEKISGCDENSFLLSLKKISPM
jgi:site-specific DNA-cytosine methylase